MNVPKTVQDWLDREGFGSVRETLPVGGGCINHGVRLVTSSQKTFFLKSNVNCPPDMFAREREGLEALRTAHGPRVPQPFLHAPDFLLLEDLCPASRLPDFWPKLGEQLALLHRTPAPRFGFPHDNYIGSTPQPNPLTDDGYVFFAEHRLIFQAGLAFQHGLLAKEEVDRVARLASRLSEYIPPQPPSLIHGDLWSGNILSDDYGQPALIDPAAYYGWAEADLAMMTLFGSPPGSFFQAYQAVRSLPPRLQERFPVYNLYHLLNHLNLFGRAYYGQVMAVLRRFT